MRRTAPTTGGQLLRSIGASLAAFAVDFGVLAFLTEAVGLHYLLSAGISFLLGTSVSYFLSVHFVFPVRRHESPLVEYALFVLVGVVGLGLNEGLLWALTEKAGIYYLASKVIAASFIFFWNFGARKYLLFRAPRYSADSSAPRDPEGS
jgi:putative flippase GtrA